MDKQVVVIFDGVCVFCNWWIRFITKRVPPGRFTFIPQQQLSSDYLKRYGLTKKINSVLVIDEPHKLFEADAIRRIACYLDNSRLLKVILKLCPDMVLLYVYRFVANNRYRIFGKTTECDLVSFPRNK